MITLTKNNMLLNQVTMLSTGSNNILIQESRNQENKLLKNTVKVTSQFMLFIKEIIFFCRTVLIKII